MASTYSTNLALELIGTGDQSGTWGATTNTNLGTLLEQAISGYTTQAVSTGGTTAITIPNGATGVARNMFIELTGTGGTNTFLTVPANKKLYFIYNNSTGAVTVKVSGQTGVSVPTGKKIALVCNGTDVVNAISYVPSFGTDSFTITGLSATSAAITSAAVTNLTSADASATVLRSASGTITNLLATTGVITNLTSVGFVSTSGSITSLAATNLTSADASATVLRAASGTITTLVVGNGTNVSPSSLSVGYIRLDGNAYDGYLTLDATAMYMGHNSGSRALVFQTDETDRLVIGADNRIGLGAGGLVTAVDVAVRGSTNNSSQYAIGVYNSDADSLLIVRNDGLTNTGDRANSPYNLTTASAANLNIASGGNLARSTSSIKYKREVETATGSLDKVLTLRPVKFRSKSEIDGNRMFGGLIAEEVHDAGLGEYVEYNKNGEPDGVMYSHLVALAFGAIQDLKKTVDDLAKEVAKLKPKN